MADEGQRVRMRGGERGARAIPGVVVRARPGQHGPRRVGCVISEGGGGPVVAEGVRANDLVIEGGRSAGGAGRERLPYRAVAVSGRGAAYTRRVTTAVGSAGDHCGGSGRGPARQVAGLEVTVHDRARR